METHSKCKRRPAMKKNNIRRQSVREGKQSAEAMTIGMDLGDRVSCYCVLNGKGEVVEERKVATTKKGLAGVRSEAAMPDGHRGGNAFPVGKPAVKQLGTRGHRGQRPASEADQPEQPQGRSFGCADIGAAGTCRPAVVAADPAPRGIGATSPDDDPGAGGGGGSAHAAGERGAWPGQVGRRTVAGRRYQSMERGTDRRSRSAAGVAGNVASADPASGGADGRDPGVRPEHQAERPGTLSGNRASPAGEWRSSVSG